MSITRDVVFKGIPLKNAVYKVQSITVQNGQLDFYVTLRANESSPVLEAYNIGCAYDKSGAPLEDQAYAYLNNMEVISNGILE